MGNKGPCKKMLLKMKPQLQRETTRLRAIARKRGFASSIKIEDPEERPAEVIGDSSAFPAMETPF